MSDLQTLRADIERLPTTVTSALREVARRTADRACALAQEHVAVDTGYTRDHIHVVDESDQKQFVVVAGTDQPRVRISLHTTRRSGRQHTQRVTLNKLPDWLEYGTSKMAARPFMRPAAAAVDADYKSQSIAAATAVAERLGV